VLLAIISPNRLLVFSKERALQTAFALLLLFDLTVFYFIYGSVQPFSVAQTVASNDGLISE
jgi:hypothetical protein